MNGDWRTPTTCLISSAILVGTAAPAVASFAEELGSPHATGAASYGLVTGDFNADGLPDVLTIQQGTGTTTAWLRQAGGGFAAETTSPISAPGAGPNFGTAADYNADGRLDVAIANNTVGQVRVYLRQAAGGFAQEGSSYDVPNGGTSQPVAADFNGDGRPDFVVLNEAGGQQGIHVFLRTPAATFVMENDESGVAPAPRRIAVGDINGDGRPDVAIATATGVVVKLRSPGGGFVQEGAVIPVGTNLWGIGIGDFNKDGRADIAVSDNDSSTLAILLRTSTNAGFLVESPVPVPAGPQDLVTTDFNGDGLTDLAVASSTADRVSVLLRNPAGGFVPDVSSPLVAATAPYAVAAADFNTDGKPDLAVTTPGLAPAMRVFLNTTPSSQVPPAKLTVKTKKKWAVSKSSTRVEKLTLKQVPVGAQVEVRCKGGNCFKKAKQVTATKSTVPLKRFFKDRPLKVGAKIEIRVTKPGTIGTVVRYKIRAAPRNPKLTTLCLPPGATSPTKC